MNTFTYFLRQIVLIIIVPLQVCQAVAADFSIGPSGFGVSIEGEIKQGDFKRFNAFISANKNKTIDYNNVFINSPGGNVAEALLFANLFSKNLSMVWVMRGNRCFSACTIIWAGGADRMLERDAKLGFHRLSLNGNEMDVRKTKAKTDLGNQKVTEFFREVGFPTLLIDKMNETPPSDIYLVDQRWLIEHELDRAAGYQPVFLDVVEKQCGVDPTLSAYKQVRPVAPSENETFKKWLVCADGVKDANRDIAVKDIQAKDKEDALENSRIKLTIAHTRWALAGENDGGSIYLDKNTAKRNGRVVKLWVIHNFKTKNNGFQSSRDYLTIDCSTGTVAASEGSFTFCEGKMCETPLFTTPNEPITAKKPPAESANGIVVNAACNQMF